MCWWNKAGVCAAVLLIGFLASDFARGETILRFDPPAKTKKAAKKKFSAKVKLPKSEPSFLLSGKRADPHILPPSPKKKPHEIESGEKNAKQVELKKPKTTFVVAGGTTFTSPPPVPMAASSTEMTVVSVPAPRALWAGLGMLGALVLWRRVCALRAAV